MTGRSADIPPVLFIGTGIMGAPMVLNIVRAGFPVSAWNRDPSKLAPLTSAGVIPLVSLAALAPAKRIAILMVSTGSVVDDILFGSHDLATRLLPGSSVVVMSSIPVDAARRQAERLGNGGIAFVDAPVSGGERGAIAGTLSIMAGGANETIKGLRAILSAMGTVHHVGPAGAGQLAKLANQAIVGITIGAVSEAFLLAKAGGADLRAVREALLGGFASSEILRQHGQRMIESSFAPGAQAHVQLKDVTTALELAKAHGVNTPLLDQITQLYGSMCEDADLCNLDHSALFRFLETHPKGNA